MHIRSYINLFWFMLKINGIFINLRKIQAIESGLPLRPKKCTTLSRFNQLILQLYSVFFCRVQAINKAYQVQNLLLDPRSTVFIG